MFVAVPVRNFMLAQKLLAPEASGLMVGLHLLVCWISLASVALLPYLVSSPHKLLRPFLLCSYGEGYYSTLVSGYSAYKVCEFHVWWRGPLLHS